MTILLRGLDQDIFWSFIREHDKHKHGREADRQDNAGNTELLETNTACHEILSRGGKSYREVTREFHAEFSRGQSQIQTYTELWSDRFSRGAIDDFGVSSIFCT